MTTPTRRTSLQRKVFAFSLIACVLPVGISAAVHPCYTSSYAQRTTIACPNSISGTIGVGCRNETAINCWTSGYSYPFCGPSEVYERCVDDGEGPEYIEYYVEEFMCDFFNESNCSTSVLRSYWTECDYKDVFYTDPC